MVLSGKCNLSQIEEAALKCLSLGEETKLLSLFTPASSTSSFVRGSGHQLHPKVGIPYEPRLSQGPVNESFPSPSLTDPVHSSLCSLERFSAEKRETGRL